MGANPNMSIADQMAYNSQVGGAASTDTTVYGWLYQWGRQADGHQKRSPQNNYPTNDNTQECGIVSGSGYFDANGQVVNTHVAYGKFIKAANCLSYNQDWRNPQEPNLWNHTTTLGQNNNPCPSGWRVPTNQDWVDVYNNNTWVPSFTTTTGTRGYEIKPNGASTSTTLFLPAAGERDSKMGVLYYAGMTGYYWNSSVTGVYTYSLSFGIGGVYLSYLSYSAYGYSLRCVAE